MELELWLSNFRVYEFYCCKETWRSKKTISKCYACKAKTWAKREVELFETREGASYE